MGTRSVIARWKDNDSSLNKWEGVYCHFDGYPAHNGRVLFHLYHNVFERNTERMNNFFIDKHRQGWSYIDEQTDPNKDYGRLNTEQREGPRAYQRELMENEQHELITQDDETWPMIKYIYILSNGLMYILNSHKHIIDIIELDNDEPEWDCLG